MSFICLLVGCFVVLFVFCFWFYLYCDGEWALEEVVQQRLWRLHSWRHSKPDWAQGPEQSVVIDPALIKSLGLENIQKSFQTPAVLCLWATSFSSAVSHRIRLSRLPTNLKFTTLKSRILHIYMIYLLPCCDLLSFMILFMIILVVTYIYSYWYCLRTLIWTTTDDK